MLYRNENHLTWSICSHLDKPYKHNTKLTKQVVEWHILFDIIYVDLKIHETALSTAFVDTHFQWKYKNTERKNPD